MGSFERQLRRHQPRRGGLGAIVYQPEKFASAEHAALVGARSQGCTCNPDIFIEPGDSSVRTVKVQHDDWCALLRRLEDVN